MQTAASNLRDSARRRAATGISNAPGTRATVMSLSATPWRRRQSRAPSRSRCEMKSLKRPTTRAIRRPFPSRFPSTTRTDTRALRPKPKALGHRSGPPRDLSRTAGSSGREAGTQDSGPGGGEKKLEKHVTGQKDAGRDVPGSKRGARDPGAVAEPAAKGEQDRLRETETHDHESRHAQDRPRRPAEQDRRPRRPASGCQGPDVIGHVADQDRSEADPGEPPG